MGCVNMAKLLNFEDIKDFTREAKDRNISRIFYTMQAARDQAAISTVITLTAITDDDKVYLSYREIAATTEGNSSPEGIKAFNEQGARKLNDVIIFLQTEHPHAQLKAGYCSPLGAQ